MNSQFTSFIFPAFVSEYIGNEIKIVRDLSDDFDTFLDIIVSKFFTEFSGFSLTDRQFTENELFSQVGSYLFGCSITAGLKKKGLIPNIVAGNSMGLYAALYCAGVVNFEDGLLLLTKAYEHIQHETKDHDMGMGAIVGLDLNDIEEIVNQSNDEISVANKNGKHSYLISGEKNGVKFALELARNEGALFTSTVLVNNPYHTGFLKNAAFQFGHFSDQHIVLKNPEYSIVSSVDQLELKTALQIRDELVKNIYKPINWYASMVSMIDTGTSCFVECGAGNSLTKLARFIDGYFKVYPVNKIGKLYGM